MGAHLYPSIDAVHVTAISGQNARYMTIVPMLVSTQDNGVGDVKDSSPAALLGSHRREIA